MNEGYQDPRQAENYKEFLESPNGQFQKKIILDAILPRLNGLASGSEILDLGCGPGWLAHELVKRGFKTAGCDVSEAQISLAKKSFPNINFSVADPQKSLPYQDNEFGAVAASLVLIDLKNQPAALKEIRRVLAPGGKLIIITLNPYYTSPVGEWKRGFWGRLLGRKPRLRLKSYFSFSPGQEFYWQKNLLSRFYPLAEQINNLLSANFTLTYFSELRSVEDSSKFNRQYQLHRFPLYLLIEAKKSSNN